MIVWKLYDEVSYLRVGKCMMDSHFVNTAKENPTYIYVCGECTKVVWWDVNELLEYENIWWKK